mgnify:CR=1 FL=1
MPWVIMYASHRRRLNFVKWFSIFLVAILTLLPLANVQSKSTSSYPLEEDDFSERKTKYFIIIFPKDYEPLADQLFSQYGKMLDEEYEKFQALYGHVVIYPLTIRVYANAKEYESLNPFAPPLKRLGTHSHVGTREIAIIGDVVAKNYLSWFAEATNAFRYELAILFAKQLSDQKAPEGLLHGIGSYFQDLAALEALVHQANQSKMEAQPWNDLFENGSIFFDPPIVVQQVSVVSYLVGIRDWETFLSFLSRMKTSPNYQVAFKEIYQRDQADLEKEWKSYLPLYASKDWKWNKLTNYNFKIAEKLINSGAFKAAYSELEKVVKYNTLLRQEDKKQTALGLMTRAKYGVDGNNNLYQGRLLLSRGNIDEAISLFNNAKQSFSSIGYTQKNNEIEALLQRAKLSLSLQAEVKRYQNNAVFVLLNGNAVKRLKEIRAIYDQMNNDSGIRTVDTLIMEVQQRQLWVFAMCGVLVAILLFLYWKKSKAPVPPEARL